MKPEKKAPKEFELAKGFKVAKCLELLEKKEREPLADFIHRRFTERYLAPLSSISSGNKSGFGMMAIACLMIESLQSFREGLEHTKDRGAGEECFRKFFKEIKAFNPLYPYTRDFYANIRCGILHQAETTGGWRVRRDKDGLLFDPEVAVVNANEFLEALKQTLDDYCAELKKADWNGKLWKPVRTKLKSICDHCGAG